MRLLVFHNAARDAQGRHVAWADGYRLAHPLIRVAEIDSPTDNVTEALHWAWQLLNVGDDPTFGTPDPQALTYRQRRNRSLHVGDVLVDPNGPQAYAVQAFDFGPIQERPDLLCYQQESVPGSTYLPDPDDDGQATAGRRGIAHLQELAERMGWG